MFYYNSCEAGYMSYICVKEYCVERLQKHIVLSDLFKTKADINYSMIEDFYAF